MASDRRHMADVAVAIVATAARIVGAAVIQEAEVAVDAVEATRRDLLLIRFIRTTTTRRRITRSRMTLDLSISSLACKWMLMKLNKKLIKTPSSESVFFFFFMGAISRERTKKFSFLKNLNFMPLKIPSDFYKGFKVENLAF